MSFQVLFGLFFLLYHMHYSITYDNCTPVLASLYFNFFGNSRTLYCSALHHGLVFMTLQPLGLQSARCFVPVFPRRLVFEAISDSADKERGRKA